MTKKIKSERRRCLWQLRSRKRTQKYAIWSIM